MVTIEISDEVREDHLASIINFGLIARQLTVQTTSGARYTGVKVCGKHMDLIRFLVPGFVNAIDGSDTIELRVSAIDRIEVES